MNQKKQSPTRGHSAPLPLEGRIRSKNFKLAVVGVGRVGLPLSVAFSLAGVRQVVGIDLNRNLIETIQRGGLPYSESGLESALNRAREKSNLSFSHKFSTLADSDVVITCVGTPLSSTLRPQIDSVRKSIEDAIGNLRKNEVLLVVRSTLPPGTTRDVISRIAEGKTQRKIHVVFSPERIMEGHALEELGRLPEIVGAESSNASRLAEALLKLLSNDLLILHTDPTSAELAKILCNVYRYTNFALANEYALIAENLGVDAWEVIALANKGYKRGGIPLPGPAGGPCLYKDGYFINDLVAHGGLTRKGWEMNEFIPLHVVLRVKEYIGGLHGKSIGVLGMTYKATSDDTRYSPALKIIEGLREQGAEVHVHDPHASSSSPIERILKCEAIVLAVNHPEFRHLPAKKMSRVRLFYDCWSALKGRASEFEEMGVRYESLGVGRNETGLSIESQTSATPRQ